MSARPASRIPATGDTRGRYVRHAITRRRGRWLLLVVVTDLRGRPVCARLRYHATHYGARMAAAQAVRDWSPGGRLYATRG